MLFPVILLLAAGGLGFAQQQCINAEYPSRQAVHGKYQVSVPPVPLENAINDVTFTNTCTMTNALTMMVCDDVAPVVIPKSLYEVTVNRLGNTNQPAYLYATYHCD